MRCVLERVPQIVPQGISRDIPVVLPILGQLDDWFSGVRNCPHHALWSYATMIGIKMYTLECSEPGKRAGKGEEEGEEERVVGV
jgi:hypothetical protein